jgi:hypothetical protein
MDKHIPHRKLFIVAVALAAMSLSLSQARADQSCASLVSSMSGGGHVPLYTPYKYVVSQPKGGFVGYVNGWISNYAGPVTSNPATQYFSDRTWNASASGHAYSNLPFNPAMADQIHFSFTPSNDIQMVLDTWGSATFTIPVSCHGSIAIGVDQNGFAYVFSFGDPEEIG